MNTPQRLIEGRPISPSVRTAILGVAAVALLLLSVLLPGLAPPAHAAGLAYRATSSYIGGSGRLYVRTAPTRSSAVAYPVRSGRRISIDCQLVGGRLGFSRYADNRTWDRLTDGRYIHDVVTTTPGADRSEDLPDGGYAVWSDGIPRCTPGPDASAPMSAPAPAPTSTPAPTASTGPSPTPTGSSAPAPDPVPSAPAVTTGFVATTQHIGGGTLVNVRRATSTSGAIAYTVPNGAPITVACQLPGDRLGFGQYADNRTWDRLSDGNYVHDVVTSTPGGTRVDRPEGGYVFWTPSIPQCGGEPASSAPAPAAYPDDDAQDCSARFGVYSWCKNGTEWSQRRFAYRNCTDYVAWRLQLGWSDVNDRTTSSANARDWRAGWLQRGRTVSDVPRIGAVAWWGASRGGGYGHVAVVIAVNTDGSVRVAQYNERGDGRYSESNTHAEAYLY